MNCSRESLTGEECTTATHDLMRANVALFKACTRNHQEWAGLLTAECRNCDSTLALPFCFLCRKPCPATDALEWNPDGSIAHFGCVARVMVASTGTRFVIVVGKKSAREFVSGGQS